MFVLPALIGCSSETDGGPRARDDLQRPPPVPANYHTITGFSTAEDFDFDGEGYVDVELAVRVYLEPVRVPDRMTAPSGVGVDPVGSGVSTPLRRGRDLGCPILITACVYMAGCPVR